MPDVNTALDQMLDAAGADGPALWAAFHRRSGHDGGRLEVHPEPSDLVGLVAPPDVWAVGTVSGGTAWHLDGGAPEQRARVAVVFDRHGRSAGRVWLGGELVELPATPPVGRVPDTLRRVLALPTDPATVPVGPVLGVEWCAALVDAASELGTLSWSLAAMLHPVAGIVAAGDDAPSARALTEATAGWSWSRTRSATVRGDVVLGCVPPRLAAWMDGGMLCRWVLGEHTDVRRLLTEATEAVEPAARRRVASVVAGARPRAGR